MSSWEDRMAERHRVEVKRDIEQARRAYLGEVFLRHYPQEAHFEAEVEILPEVIAANCLGISYGDPGPRLPADHCHECWGERFVWLGNCWGVQHVNGQGNGPGECPHACHEGEVWLAS